MFELINIVINFVQTIFGIKQINTMSTTNIELRTKYKDIFQNIIDNYNYDNLTVNVCLALIKKESGLSSLRKKNSEVIGDKTFQNKAYGYLQIRLPALTDTNSYYGYTYTEQDLQDSEIINFIVGFGYLSMLLKKAVEYNLPNPLEKTFTRYNSGRYGTSHYGTLAMSYVQLFNNLG